jgi:hypothetical protein
MKTELSRTVQRTAFMGNPTYMALWSHPPSWSGHRLAILVHKGSDPTLPYQALVTRESASLFKGFAPWGQ